MSSNSNSYYQHCTFDNLGRSNSTNATVCFTLSVQATSIRYRLSPCMHIKVMLQRPVCLREQTLATILHAFMQFSNNCQFILACNYHPLYVGEVRKCVEMTQCDNCIKLTYYNIAVFIHLKVYVMIDVHKIYAQLHVDNCYFQQYLVEIQTHLSLLVIYLRQQSQVCLFLH